MAVNWQPVGDPVALQSYDTQLSDKEEAGYREWMGKIGHSKESGYRVDEDFNGEDYDYRGFYKKNGPVDVAAGQHFTDEFKKPNHETFSDESRYATGKDAARAGHWNGEQYESAKKRWQPAGDPQPYTGDFHVAGLSSGRRAPPQATAEPAPDEYKTSIMESLGESLGEDFALPSGADVATSVRAGLARIPQGMELESLEEQRALKLGQVRNTAGDLGMPALPNIPRGEVLDYSTTAAQRRALQGDRRYLELEDRLATVRGAGREMTADEQGVAARNPGFWQQAALTGATSIAQSAPALAVGLATRNPVAAVSTMYPATKATTYSTLREQGVEQTRARLAASVDAAIEVATELLPMDELLKPGTPAFRRFIGVVGAELPGESLAQIGQTLNEYLASLPEGITGQDWFEGLKEGTLSLPQTWASVFLAAGAQTGAVAAASRGKSLKAHGAEPPKEQGAQRREPTIDAPEPTASAPASVAAADQPAGAAPGVERYQMQRTKGQLLGTQYEVRPITEEDFQYYLKPALPVGHAKTLQEYQQKHPSVTYVRTYRSPGQESWRLDKAGSEHTVRPTGDIARQVQDFEAPEAKTWAALDGEKSTREDPNRLDVQNDSILTAIAKLGGLDREEAQAQGLDPAHFAHRGHRISLTFRKNGMSFDQMAEALNEFGYPVQNAEGSYDPNVLLDLIGNELAGKPTRSQQSALEDEAAKLEQRGQEQQALAEPITVDDLITQYAQYPGAIEDDTPVGTLHEPQHYPGDFDESAKKLADLTELAQQIDPDAAEQALQSPSDAEAARRLWSIVTGETDVSAADEETLDLSEDIGEVAAQAGQEQSQQGAEVHEGREDGGADTEDEIADPPADLQPPSMAGRNAPAALPVDESVQARPDETPVEPPPQDTVGVSSGGPSVDLLGADAAQADALTAANARKARARGEGRAPVPADKAPRGDMFREQSEAEIAAEHAKQVEIDDAAHEAATSPHNDLPHPTEAQKEAGNYQKGHLRVQGLDVTIENPTNSTRTNYSEKAVEAARKDQLGKEARRLVEQSLELFRAGRAHEAVMPLRQAAQAAKEGLSGTSKLRDVAQSTWAVQMPAHYGYIRRTEGADGEHIDVTLGPKPDDETLPVFVLDQGNEAGSFDEHKVFIGFADESAARRIYRYSFQGQFGTTMERRLLGVRKFTPNEFKAWLASADLTLPATHDYETAKDKLLDRSLADVEKSSGPQKTLFERQDSVEKAAKAGAEAAGQRWDALDYGAREKLAESVYGGLRKVVHRIAGSKWSQLGGGEHAEMAQAMVIADASKVEIPTQQPTRVDKKVSRKDWTVELGIVKDGKVRLTKAIDYLSPKEYVVDWVSKNHINFRDPATGGASSLNKYQVMKAVQDGTLQVLAQGDSAPVKTPISTGEESTDDTGPTPARSKRLADWVKGHLAQQEAFTWDQLFKMANFVFGGTQAEGKYSPKDAYDAAELGVNLYLRNTGMRADGDIATARTRIASLEKMLDLIPTQTKRTEEQDEFQQFSTPPHYSFVVSWVGHIQTGESVLDPSAGVGGLAIYARNAEAKVIVNELSPRRAQILAMLGFERVFRENAEQLNNVLPADVKPTLILMNPPFSATAGRKQGSRSTAVGAQHIEQALKRLEPNGRLVAIVGEGMAADRSAFQEWWAGIKKNYTVRANVGIDGSGYRKYGTTFDNQLLVIDKTGPTQGAVVTGKVQNVVDLLPLLEGIRNDRRTIADREGAKGEPVAAASIEHSGDTPTATGLERPTDLASRQPDAVGDRGGRGDSGSAGSGTARQRGVGEFHQPSLGLESAEGHGPADIATERRGRDTGGGRAESGEVTEGSGETVTGSASRGDGSDSGIAVEQIETHAGALTDSIFEQYTPQRVKIPGAKPHPGKLVQSAAMASVLPPKATYTPNLPKAVIQQGMLSDAQLESVIYAGQAHQQQLEDGTRRGYFIGDGTGVGKGREISGIILDEQRQGRKKHIWMSEKQPLIVDAQRDYSGVGGNKDEIFWHGATKAPDAIERKQGILFSTYATLRSAEKKPEAGKAPKTRLQQLIEWAGPNFDGVIVFDEAHNAGNAIMMKGKRGSVEPSAQALAVVDLQAALPQARIVYVSATGATELRNLSYATRLGIWGKGKPFADARSFISELNQGGLAAMELVARDLKQMGVYTARALSYDGVTYERLEHKLTEIQHDIYNELARAWQLVLGTVYEALEITEGNKDRFAKSNALSAFWGSHQRFFNQVITSMQMPTVLDDVAKRLDEGKAVVLQLVNTNEATQERKLASMKDEQELDDLDLTPRENLIQYIQNSFPVIQYEEYQDEESEKVRTRPAKDSEGNVILNKEAVAMRDALIKKLEMIRVPDGPLEMLLNEFGAANVAEVTGRSRRIVRDRDGKVSIEKRGRNAAQADAADFQGDKKRILVFSDAGGTGYSFQSDLTKKNQRKRSHYLLQPGWRADKAVQGFGRTHRTNQASEPEYILVQTDLAAQKRFISSIARRLDQLGALTKGQRDTANQGMFSASDNLESGYAEDAVWAFFQDLYSKKIEGLDFKTLTAEMGLDLLDDEDAFKESKIPEVPKFLNRLLSLTRERQDEVFNEFLRRMEDIVAVAKASGEFDAGMETLDAVKVEVKREAVVYTDPESGAETKYVELELTRDRVVRELPERKETDYYRNKKSGRVWAVSPAGMKTSRSGKVEPRYRMAGTTSERGGSSADIGVFSGGYSKITQEEARKLWEAENAALGPTYTMPAHLITGAVLPIWDRLEGMIRVVRTQAEDGRRYLGRMIHVDDVAATLQRLNVDAGIAKTTPAEAMKKILQGDVATMANGWRLLRARVSNEQRIELRASSSYLTQALKDELKSYGVFVERVDWQERYFVPTGAKGEDAIAGLTKNRPIVEFKDIEKSDVTPSRRHAELSAEHIARIEAFNEEIDLKRVREHFTRIASRWQGMKGRVIVRRSEYDVPWKYAKNFFDNGEVGTVGGFFARDTGDIYLLPGNWTSIEEGETTLFHEAEGHLSIQQFFGSEIIPYLNRVFLVDPAGVKRVGLEHGYYDKDGKPTQRVNFSHRLARIRSADEYVARLAETVNSKSPKSMQRLWDWLVSHFAENMRRVGWRRFKPSEAEIRGFLRRAQHSLAKRGHDLSAAAARALTKAGSVTAERLNKQQQQLGIHPSWNSPEASRLDSVIHALQDRHIDTKRVMEAIRQASSAGLTVEDTNVYLKEELFHGRVAKRVEDFLDDELKPLLKDMTARAVDMFELNRFLHARHAKERNEQIASINPDMPDGGSGMTTAEADTYLSQLNADERRDLEALAGRVDRILEGTRDLLVAYGLEAPATIDIWRDAYDHYVPLFREDMDVGTPGTGQGFSVRGPASKRALGSFRQVANIIASVAQQREKALVRGEKNRVANALVGLALENPNEDFWRVDTPPMIRYLSPLTGLVEEMVDPNWKHAENVVVARIPDNNGRVLEHAVIFNEDNPRATRMALALKNLDTDQLGVVLGAFAKVTRYFASINTQYNPIFGMVNIYRDLQEGLLNLTSTPLAGRQAAITKYTVAALRGIYIETRARRKGGRRQSSWADLWEEFQHEGGQTGYRDMFNTGAERADAIAKEIRQIGTKNAAKLTFRAIGNWLSDYNLAMENAVRLATYRVGRESGLSAAQSASIAKNLTVNFNRRGAWGTQAGALYAFFNASVQGTARIVETLTGPKGKAIIVGGIMVGVIQALMMAAAGFDDDDIPEFSQENNLILPLYGTDRKYLSLPYPLGFRFLPNLGRIATQYVMSGWRLGPERVTNMLGVLMDNFNPIGNAGLSAQTIAPTAADPIVALGENRDWTGQKIALEDFDRLNPTPGFTRAKANASAMSTEVARILNFASGGTEYVPGVFSPTPDQIDYLIGQATGGVGREALKTMQTAESLFSGEQLPSYKIPLVGRLYGTAADQAGESRAFYENIKKLNMMRNEIKGRAEDGKDFDEFIDDNPAAELALGAGKAERMVSDLRRQKRRLMSEGASREDITAIDRDITETMAEINRQVSELEKRR